MSGLSVSNHARHTIVLTIALLSIGLCGSCRPSSPKGDKMSNEEVFQIAAQYIEKFHPDWKEELGFPHKVADHGDYWLVTFALPPHMQGGAPVLHVDKQSRRVVQVFHEQ